MKSVLIAIILAALCMVCAWVAFEGGRLERQNNEFKP